MTIKQRNKMKSYRRKDNSVKNAEKFWNSVLNRKTSMLSEMAIPLKMFIRDIEGLKFQIVQNWCLCKWCQLFDPMNDNFNHWKEELSSYMLQLQNTKIKNGISKKKHLNKYFIDYYEFNDKDVVIGAIRDKFYKENIIDQKQINVVAIKFTQNIEQLINVISDSSKIIMTYIHEMFD